MKRVLILIFLYFPFAAVCLQSQNEKINGSLLVNSTTSKTWAVIIGISKYQNIQGLNFADRDAQAFYNYLVNKNGGPRLNPVQVRLLLNENALSTEIYGALDWLSESVKENDRVIFYFSGHGDVETKTTNRDGFLLAYNSPKAAYMTSGTVSVNYLQKYLENYVNVNKAKNVILIADACRSGKLAGGLEGTELTTQALGRNSDSRITRMLSAQENELSLEGSKWGGGRGVFSYYLVKGLEGLADRNNDNQVSTAELADYLLTVIPDVTGNTQHPEIEGDAKQELFPFDKHSASTLKDDENLTPFTTDNMGIGIADELVPDIQITYKKYLDYVKDGKLIWGDTEADTINCARHIYWQLINRSGAESIRASLKSSFIAALQQKAEEILNDYVKGDQIKSNIYVALKEIFYVKELINPEYILHDYIMAHANFFFFRFYGSNADTAFKLLKKTLYFERDAPYALCELGGFYQSKKMDDSALCYYQKAMLVAPLWSYPYVGIGLIYCDIKDYNKALLNYQKAIELDSTNVEAYNDIGVLYQELNEHSKALIYHQKALQINQRKLSAPTYESKSQYFQQGVIYCSVGIDYHLLKIYDKAIENYQKAVEIDTMYSSAYDNMGVAYQKMGNYDKAITNFKKAISIDSTGRVDFYTDMAAAYLEMKQYKNSISCLQKAFHLTPHDPAISYSLASAYSLQGDVKNSFEYFKTALENKYPDYEHIMQDADLTNLRKHRSFNKLMEQYFPDKLQLSKK